MFLIGGRDPGWTDRIEIDQQPLPPQDVGIAGRRFFIDRSGAVVSPCEQSRIYGVGNDVDAFCVVDIHRRIDQRVRVVEVATEDVRCAVVGCPHVERAEFGDLSFLEEK